MKRLIKIPQLSESLESHRKKEITKSRDDVSLSC